MLSVELFFVIGGRTDLKKRRKNGYYNIITGRKIAS
jgi:hypothetical protein